MKEIVDTDSRRLTMKSAIERMRDSASDMPEIFFDDIDAEISAARGDRKKRKIAEALTK